MRSASAWLAARASRSAVALPVLQVADWGSITPAYLEERWRNMTAPDASHDWSRLYAPYWLSRIMSAARGEGHGDDE